MARLFFDFDGVLVRSRLADRTFLWQENLDRDLKIPYSIKSILFQQPDWSEIVSGKGNFKHKVEEIFRQNNLSISAQEFIDYWLSQDLNWHHDVLAVAASLKQDGHSLYVATNQDALRANYIKKQDKILKIFDAVFASCELGICKPSPKFFQAIQNQNNFSASQDVFVMMDDDQRNVDAASSVGWQGIRFDPDLEKSHSAAYLQRTLSSVLN